MKVLASTIGIRAAISFLLFFMFHFASYSIQGDADVQLSQGR